MPAIFSAWKHKIVKNIRFLNAINYLCVCAKSLQLGSDSATPWTIACQAPLYTGFSTQEYWSWLPCLPPGDLPNPRTEPPGMLHLLHWQVGSLPLVPHGKPQIIYKFEKYTSHMNLLPTEEFSSQSRKTIWYDDDAW